MGDGMKTRLKIQLNDQAKWLFAKVDSLHGAKITWKQIRKYLEKTISVRDEMRDFFHDNARDRDFEEKKAEITNGIADAVEAHKEATESMEEKLLAQLYAIKAEMEDIKSKMGDANAFHDVEQIRLRPVPKSAQRLSEKKESPIAFVSSKVMESPMAVGDDVGKTTFRE